MSTPGRRPHAATKATTGSAKRSGETSKKRRYIDTVAHCQNPFCGAVLTNTKQRYCDDNRLCQLHRGLIGHCAWPTDPYATAQSRDKPSSSSKAPDAVSSDRATKGKPVAPATTAPPLPPPLPAPPAQSSRKGAPPLVSTSRPSLSKASSVVSEPAEAIEKGGGKRPRTTTEEDATSRDGKRQRVQAPDRQSTTKTSASVQPSSVPTPSAAQQIKAAGNDVVALGVGSRSAGGRYVQSGARGSPFDTSIVRPPSYGKFTAPPTPTPTPPLTATMPVPASASSSNSLPFAPMRVPPPATARALIRANSTSSLPTSSADRSRDPRLARDAKRISAADYLNTRNREATAKDSEAKPPETLLTSRPPQPTTAPVAARAAPSDPRILRRTLSDTVTASTPLQSSKSEVAAAKRSDVPPSQPSASHDSYYRPREREYSSASTNQSRREDDNSLPTQSSSSYRRSYSDQVPTSERPTLSRASSASSTGVDIIHQSPSSRSAEAPALSHAQRTARSLLQPKFSHCDPFIRLVLTRMASFLPNALGAVRNKTTKPRKLQFYLQYANRVTEYCGSLVKVVVESGVGRVLVAGRAWLTVEGTSTTELYQQVLEKLLRESELWRDLIEEFQNVDAKQRRGYGAAAVPGVCFLKLWSALKCREQSQLTDIEFQSNYVAGGRSHHWSFVIGTVEIGSSSQDSKIQAFRNATTCAFTMLQDLMILPDKDKYLVAKIDQKQQTRGGSSSSPRRESSSTTSGSSRNNTSSSTGSNANRENSSRVAPRASILQPAAATTLTASASTSAPMSGIILDEPAATGERRQRGNSWTDTGELDAVFSPTARSESEHQDDDDEDNMSISDDDHAHESKPPVPVVPAAAAAPAPAQVPVDSPTCRFCLEMQSVKPGRKCLKHEREASAADAHRSVDAVHAFLRQPTANVVSPSNSVTPATRP